MQTPIAEKKPELQTTSKAETGDYHKFAFLDAQNRDRTVYAKGRGIVVFHPLKLKSEDQQSYNPEQETAITVPKDYKVRVVEAWVAEE